MAETARVDLDCEGCGISIEIEQNWTAGGVNDRAGVVLKCDACGHVFEYHVGRDVNDPCVVRGAKILARYDDDIGEKAAILKAYGLA
jgi:uncharacterized Zn finger protein